MLLEKLHKASIAFLRDAVAAIAACPHRTTRPGPGGGQLLGMRDTHLRHYQKNLKTLMEVSKTHGGKQNPWR
jgi:hypothetical protein